MTLLDHLPSLRRAASQRIAAESWPRTTVVDELGQLCVGGVALTDVAAEFGTPVHVLDETDFRHRLRHYRAESGEMVPVFGGSSLPTTVMGWVDDEGLGLAIRRGTDLAAALAAGVNPARMVLNARGLSHDELVLGASIAPGRIVVDSTMDVAYLCGATCRGQRILVGAIGGRPDPVTIERVLGNPMLQLVGFHCYPTGDIASSVRSLMSSMKDVYREHGVLLTEIHLNIGADMTPADLAAATEDAVDAACAATRLPRPRLVVEPRWPVMRLAGVTVYRVASVVAPADGPRIVVVDVGLVAEAPNGVVVLANRHPLSTNERVIVMADGAEIARDVDLPCDIHPGDVLAVADTCANDGDPVIAVRNGVASALLRRVTVDDVLSHDLDYSADRGHHQHRGR